MTRTAFASDVIAIAKKHVGDAELPGNGGWHNKRLEEAMRDFGWQRGWAWCALFSEYVWRTAAQNAKMEALDKRLDVLFSASAVVSWRNFDAAEDFETRHGGKILSPKSGDLVYWQHGSTAQGHAGIVLSASGNRMMTIEGNTNAAGSREGTVVAIKSRPVGNDGALRVLGFVRPKTIFFDVTSEQK